MAVSYVGVSNGNSAAGTSTSFVTTFPAGWAADDVAILTGHVRGTSLTMTVPAGWLPLPGTWPVNQGANSRTYGWYRVLQAGDSAPTITNSGATTGGWEMTVYRGADTLSPIGQVNTSSISSTSLTMPTLTGVLASSAIAAHVHAGVASGTIPTSITYNAVYTEVVDAATSRATTAANIRIAAAYRLIASAGNYGGEAVTSSVTASMIALLVEVKQATSVSTVALSPAIITVSAPPADPILPNAPWIRNATESGTGAGTATTHSVAIPTCQVGDDLWAAFTLNGGHGVVTDPSGWTRVFPTTITDDGVMTLLVYRKAATATEVAGGNVSVIVGTAVRGNAGAVSVANADTGALDGSTTSSSSGAAGTATTATSFVTTVANTLVLSIVALDSGVEVAVSPSTLIERWNPTRNGITGQANAGAAAIKTGTGAASWNWSWSTSLMWKTWAGAIMPLTASAVTLTPATSTIAAVAVTAAPSPTSVTLTPATLTLSGIAVSAAPGPTSATLTPKALTITAPAVVSTIVVQLSRPTATITAVSVAATPQPVNITLAPVTLTITAAVASIGSVGAVTLAPAGFSVTAVSITAAPGAVNVALTPAVSTLTPVAPIITMGAISVTLSPATVSLTALTVNAAPGVTNLIIVPAQATITVGSVFVTLVAGSEITLTPAEIHLLPNAPIFFTETPGVDLMTIAFATVTGVGEYIRGELVDTEGGVPQRFALVVPGSIAWDNCDCGQFAQSITSVVSSRVFPTPAADQPVESCGHPQAIVSVTLSLLRCVPTVDDNGNAPSVEKLLAAARVIEDDRQTLRRALACHMRELYRAYKILNYTIGNAQSVGPEGMCGGVEINYSFGIHNDAMCC